VCRSRQVWPACAAAQLARGGSGPGELRQRFRSWCGQSRDAGRAGRHLARAESERRPLRGVAAIQQRLARRATRPCTILPMPGLTPPVRLSTSAAEPMRYPLRCQAVRRSGSAGEQCPRMGQTRGAEFASLQHKHRSARVARLPGAVATGVPSSTAGQSRRFDHSRANVE